MTTYNKQSKSSMKLLVVVDNMYINDPRVRNEVEIATKLGYQVTVLRFKFGTDITPKSFFGEKIISVSLSKKLKDILFGLQNIFPFYDHFWAFHIKKQIKKNKPDLIHVHDLYMSKSAFIATKHYKIPFVVDLHENYPAAINSYEYANRFPKNLIVKPKLWQKKEKSFLNYASGIISLSEHYKNYLIQKYPELTKIEYLVYPNVVNIKQLLNYPINEIDPELKNQKIILYFGVVGKRRGAYTAIDAIKKLVQEEYKVLLLLIGPIDKAEKNELETLININDNKQFIKHIPWKDISEIPSYIQASYLCISPIVKNDQHESGLANKIFQYMLFEKPIVVSDCQPQVEIVDKHQCGLHFRSEDSEDLAQKIKFLLDHETKAKTMGKNGKVAVMDMYNTEAYTRSFELFYNKITSFNPIKKNSN